MRLRWFPSTDYTWRDLLVWIEALPETSATYRHQVGEDNAFWTPERHLLASVIDTLNVQVWQQTKDGRKGRNQPHPIPRPGVEDDRREVHTHGKKKDVKTASEIAELLGI